MADNQSGSTYGRTADNRLPTRMSSHVHEYRGVTVNAETGILEHDHQFFGTTGGPIMVGEGRHVHRYSNYTTIDRNHRHGMKGTTGVNIDISGGGHIHGGKGRTTADREHAHDYKLSTSIAWIDQSKNKKTCENNP